MSNEALGTSEKQGMAYFVIIRGPLGVGKTTVALRLAKELSAEYISIDQILDHEGLWDEGKLSEFLGANQFAADRAIASLAKGRPVIFDGNFYWREQIDDLLERLAYPHYAFTLEAPLSVCIERDAGRSAPHGSEAARQVYEKTTRVEYRIRLDAAQPAGSIVHEITSRIATERAKPAGPAHPARAAQEAPSKLR